MFRYDCILAAVMVTTSPDAPLEPDWNAWLQACRTEIVGCAVDLEILDPREQSATLAFAHEGERDLKALRARFHDFLGAPLAGEAGGLPTRRAIDDFLALNRAYRVSLLARLEVDQVHAEDLRRALAETEDLHFLWGTARDARCGFYHVPVRREALRLLRKLLGPEAYYEGRLPPPVPVWRIAVSR